MIRLDIYSSYRIKFMLSWIYIFAILPIISLFLFIFSNWYFVASILLFLYFIIGIVAFYVGYKKSNQLIYRYIILYDDYFEIEDRYGNYLRFDKTVIYPSKEGFISVLFNTFSFAKGYSMFFIDNDFAVDNGIEKINCYVSYKSYRVLKQLDYKYIYHRL